MKLTFIGCGNAFASRRYWQSNMILEADDGAKLLFDCGGDMRHALEDANVKVADIEAVYVSHLHADHLGGMQDLALMRFFAKDPKRPIFFCNDKLMCQVWECVKGGLETIQGRVVTLTDYFDCRPVENNGWFLWHGLFCRPLQTVHIVSGYMIQYSYGLLIWPLDAPDYDRLEVGKAQDGIALGMEPVFITADTQFCPKQICTFYNIARIIFQDCETAPFKSGVHAHYDDLKTLSPEVKKKMWLYHYQADPPQAKPDNSMRDLKEALSAEEEKKALPPLDPMPVYKKDGFAGFVQKGQAFDL